MNQLGLTAKYEGRVRLCFDIIEKLIPASEIYLYGKYAQYGSACTWLQASGGTYSMLRNYAIDQMLKYSKVGILVLVEEDGSHQKMQTLCWEVENLIYAISEDSFLRDIKVLSKSFYKECIEKSPDIQRLDRYKKNLREIEWIDK